MCCILNFFVLGALLGARCILAEEVVLSDNKFQIELKAQNLVDALHELEARTNTRIVVSPDVSIAGIYTQSISGIMSVVEAASMLLENSGLKVRADSSKYLVIGKVDKQLSRSKENNEADAKPKDTVLPVLTVDASRYERSFIANYTNSSTRSTTHLMETPQSIQVVTEEVIRRQQSKDIVEALRNVSGFGFSSSAQGDANSGEPTINGFKSNVMVNGSLSNKGLSLPISAVSRVDVIKGADAIISGQGGPGGTINVVTKKPEFTRSRELAIRTTSNGQRIGSLDLNDSINGSENLFYRAIISGEVSERDNDGYFGKQDRYLRPSVRLKDDDSDVVLTYEYRKTKNPYSRFSIVNKDESISHISTNKKAHSEYLSNKIEFDWKQRIFDGFDFHSVASYSESNFFSPDTYFYGGGGEGSTHRVSVNGNSKSTSRSASYDNNFEYDVSLGAVSQRLMVGYTNNIDESTSSTAMKNSLYVSSLNDFTDRYIHKIVDGTEDIFMSNSKSYYSNLYFQDSISIKRLHILLSAARAKNYSKGQSKDLPNEAIWNPNYGVAYELTDNWTVFANKQSAFYPQANIFTGPGQLAPPITSKSEEAGLKYQSPNGKFIGNFIIRESEEMNALLYSPGYRYPTVVPVGKNTRGISLDVSGELFSGLNIVSSYSYNEYATPKGANYIFSNPEHSGSLWVSYDFQEEPLRKWGIGAGIWARSSYPINITTQTSRKEMPGQARTDVNINYRDRGWSVILGVKNIFNRQLYSEGGSAYALGTEPRMEVDLDAILEF